MQYTFAYGSPPEARHTGSFLFVVIQMRSYSSLLCHILGSHPEISGYTEAHQSYSGRADLKRLAATVRAATGTATLGRYVLDKILHNYAQIAPSVLGRPDVKVRFLVRRPEDTIMSILNMSLAVGHTGQFSDPEHEQVLEYYVTRLQQIDAYSEQLGRNALLIEAERLMIDTTATLNGLAQWLNLDQPLSENYRMFNLTGVPSYSDPSPNIKAGTVVTDAAQRHRTYVPIAVPQDILARANAAYTAYWEKLASRSDVR